MQIVNLMVEGGKFVLFLTLLISFILCLYWVFEMKYIKDICWILLAAAICFVVLIVVSCGFMSINPIDVFDDMYTDALYQARELLK